MVATSCCELRPHFRFAAALAALVALGLFVRPTPTAAQIVRGTPILATAARGARSLTSAQMVATPQRPALTLRIEAWLRDRGTTVRAYDWDMTKKLHLIVVDDNLGTFMHVHPVLGSDGHFRLLLRLPHRGIYHLYADGIPHGLGRQVFRFELSVRGLGIARRPLTARGNIAYAGPYRLAIDRTSVPVGEPAIYHVTITKRGKPAQGLRPYLGAMGHGVLIGEDLSYMHVHAMDAMMMRMMGTDDCGDAVLTMQPVPPDSPVSPELQFYLQAPHAGLYKFWLQFADSSRNYAAAWVMRTR